MGQAWGSLLKHPDEVVAQLRLRRAVPQHIPADPHLAFCYAMLLKVSRSFAIVIQQLGQELRDAICIFYLVLRALDTVEDDMSIPVDTKLPILKKMHGYIYDPSWLFPCGQRDYRVLMENFYHISEAFLRLEKRYQEIIEDITNRMGHGMAKFLCKEVETVADYDEYCHYVAGLVGIGLSSLFCAAKLEELAPEHLSNSMGLFLQKVNIIRDYLEDISELPTPRMFWPREIWGKYVSKLEDFKDENNTNLAIACLNELITNSLEHAPDCLKYMSAVRDLEIFRFAAIPQIVAIATLAACYNNIEVFRGVVKIRRGLTAKIIIQTRSMDAVYGAFFEFTNILIAKIEGTENGEATLKRVKAIQEACQASGTLCRRRAPTLGSKMSHEIILVVSLLVLLMTMLFAVKT